MPPALAPIINQPVTCPVIVKRLSAKENIVGNIEAIESPKPTAPTQTAASACGHNKMMATLSKQLSRLPSKRLRGLKRAAKGMAIKRPRVSDPQKAEVKYLAT